MAKPGEGDKTRALLVVPFMPWPDCAKRVCLNLVDRCNRETGQCDPGGTRIAHDCRLVPRTAWKGIKFLCHLGVIDRIKDGVGNRLTPTDWRHNRYTINWTKLNVFYAELLKHRHKYRRPKSAKKPVTENVTTMSRSKKQRKECARAFTHNRVSACTSVHTDMCTSVHTKLETTTLKKNNLENACGVGAGPNGHGKKQWSKPTITVLELDPWDWDYESGVIH